MSSLLTDTSTSTGVDLLTAFVRPNKRYVTLCYYTHYRAHASFVTITLVLFARSAYSSSQQRPSCQCDWRYSPSTRGML